MKLLSCPEGKLSGHTLNITSSPLQTPTLSYVNSQKIYNYHCYVLYAVELGMQVTHILGKNTRWIHWVYHLWEWEECLLGYLGLQLVITSNRINPVYLLTELLYVNSVIRKTKSQADKCSLTKHHSKSGWDDSKPEWDIKQQNDQNSRPHNT